MRCEFWPTAQVGTRHLPSNENMGQDCDSRPLHLNFYHKITAWTCNFSAPRRSMRKCTPQIHVHISPNATQPSDNENVEISATNRTAPHRPFHSSKSRTTLAHRHSSCPQLPSCRPFCRHHAPPVRSYPDAPQR